MLGEQAETGTLEPLRAVHYTYYFSLSHHEHVSYLLRVQGIEAVN
jgi:hypothetical protein